MAYKQFMLDERTPVVIYKRRSSRNLRLTIAPTGEIKVSIPAWTPYRVGLEFARSRRGWIDRQPRQDNLLRDRQPIGKAHRLRFVPSNDISQVTTRLRHNDVVVTYPASQSTEAPAVQAAARRAGVRALRRQAEALLPQRLAHLAEEHGFRYGSVTVKQLKGRWGSCDQHANIVLNLYLMQLPWEHIDYVLLHELTHTQVLRHGPDFWRAMERVLPNVKQLRKAVREHQPVLRTSSLAT